MINKYKEHFSEMWERITKGEKPLSVIADYIPMFEEEGIGHLGLIKYLTEYIRNK